MENGSELREAKEAVIEHDGQLNGNEPTTLVEGFTSSSDWVEERILDADLSTESKPVDYSNCDKKALVGLLKDAAAVNDFKRADDLIREIKPLFDEIRQRERTEALIRFKENGGTNEDFEFKGDEWDHAFDIYLKSIRDNRQRQTVGDAHRAQILPGRQQQQQREGDQTADLKKRKQRHPTPIRRFDRGRRDRLRCLLRPARRCRYPWTRLNAAAHVALEITLDA